MLERAKELSDFGKLNNSIRQGDGNLVGCLGELCALHCTNFGEIELANTYDYDLIAGDLNIDVKTKECTSKPRLEYDCSVAAFNIKQDCDIYLFVRVLNNYQKGWVLGWIEKYEYFKKAKFFKRGEIDPSNNFTVKADCYNLKIKDLYSCK